MNFLRINIVIFLLSLSGFLMAQVNKNQVKTIIVDAGHGGSDSGAPGTVTNEATITLSVAQKLAKALRTEFPSIKILETRPTTAFPGYAANKDAANKWRADFANRNGGDLFISLHCNAAGRKPGGWYEKMVVGHTNQVRTVKKGKKHIKKTVRVPIYEDFWVENKAVGTETYIWAVGKNDQKISSVKNNDDYYNEETETSDNLQLPDPNDPAEKARMLIYAQHYFRKSYLLANLVEQEFTNEGRTSRGVQQRNHKGIWVLQATGMPSILIEMGFISNKEEEQYMMSETGQEAIVKNIVKAVKNYVEKTHIAAEQTPK